MNGCINNDITHARSDASRGTAPASAAETHSRFHAVGNIRRFSQVLLATMLSTGIIIADRMVDAWTSGGLLLALAVLWLAVFTGLVLFSRLSVRLAVSAKVTWRDLTRGSVRLPS